MGALQSTRDIIGRLTGHAALAPATLDTVIDQAAELAALLPSAPRAALAAHLAKIRALEADITRVQEPIAHLALAEKAVWAATAGLADIDQREADVVRMWVDRGSNGPMPAPLLELREAAARTLTGATATAAAAKRVADGFQADAARLHAELGALRRDTKPLIVAVLVEEAEQIAAAYLQAGRAAIVRQMEIDAIAAWLQRAGAADAMTKVMRSVHGEPELVRREFADRARAWAELGDRLGADASAIVVGAR
jgi:hypothetical protein